MPFAIVRTAGVAPALGIATLMVRAGPLWRPFLNDRDVGPHRVSSMQSGASANTISHPIDANRMGVWL